MRKGQALIETLVAVSVLTVGFLGLIGLLTRSLGLNRVVSENYTATYLGAEGVEVIKNILDHNYAIGNWPGISSGNYEVQYDSLVPESSQNRILTFNPATEIYSYANGAGTIPTRFRRVISVEALNDEVKVNSRVTWITRGGGSFNIDTEDHFFNWKKYANQ